jgi:hypothetical protein
MEKRIAGACRATGAPRPDWMADRSLLPKRPPGRQGPLPESGTEASVERMGRVLP